MSGYEPGIRLELTFDRGVGVRGTHVFTVEAMGRNGPLPCSPPRPAA